MQSHLSDWHGIFFGYAGDDAAFLVCRGFWRRCFPGMQGFLAMLLSWYSVVSGDAAFLVCRGSWLAAFPCDAPQMATPFVGFVALQAGASRFIVVAVSMNMFFSRGICFSVELCIRAGASAPAGCLKHCGSSFTVLAVLSRT